MPATMKPSALEAWEKQSLLVFASFLEDCDPADEKTFAEIIRYALESHGFKAIQFSKEFGINSSTVGRWALGKNKPHKLVRPLIVNWIKKNVERRAKEISSDPRMIKKLRPCPKIS